MTAEECRRLWKFLAYGKVYLTSPGETDFSDSDEVGYVACGVASRPKHEHIYVTVDVNHSDVECDVFGIAQDDCFFQPMAAVRNFNRPVAIKILEKAVELKRESSAASIPPPSSSLAASGIDHQSHLSHPSDAFSPFSPAAACSASTSSTGSTSLQANQETPQNDSNLQGKGKEEVVRQAVSVLPRSAFLLARQRTDMSTLASIEVGLNSSQFNSICDS